MRKSLRLWTAASAAVVLLSIAWPGEADAYVGPGAGIAFLTTIGGLFVSMVIAASALFLYPIRQLYRLLTGQRPPRPPQIERAVVVGLDGFDPDLARRFMDRGRLPNLARLASMGMFSKLETTYPAMSPVAWSTFATGVNPSKHGIFDFLTRDPKSYLPDLSSAEVLPPARHLDLGKWRVPLGKPRIRLNRKSTPFWNLLGKYRVPCSILRVPITFPPQKFDGTLLSAMCVPDLQGSQGTFTYFTTAAIDGESIGGQCVTIELEGGVARTAIPGPANPLRADESRLDAPLEIEVDRANRTVELRLEGEKVRIGIGQYSDWVSVAFKMGLGLKLRGICRFRLMSLEPELKLYMSPINIDPSKPVLPISHPLIFSVFLAKLLGRFGTLGLAEDTWALNERVLDEQAFLEQAWAFHAEREAMFFEMLDRTPRGLLTCVFDGSDRIQHMFMRYLDDGHPARRFSPDHARWASVIEDTYAKLDAMIGKVLEKVNPEDPRNLVMVISDHGFKTFRRGVNLNSWLMENGYLVLEEGRSISGEWLRGVDWSKTRAYAIGLGGIFLNVRGREAKGIVRPQDAKRLADRLAAELTGLVDPGVGGVAIKRCYASHTIFDGPYAEDAPDLIVGYAEGWRHSWDGARGIAGGVVFDDNEKSWSGDHCIDPSLVPGVMFANRAFEPRSKPAISDLAPTLLDLFGVPAPRYMDGVSLVSGP